MGVAGFPAHLGLRGASVCDGRPFQAWLWIKPLDTMWSRAAAPRWQTYHLSPLSSAAPPTTSRPSCGPGRCVPSGSSLNILHWSIQSSVSDTRYSEGRKMIRRVLQRYRWVSWFELCVCACYLEICCQEARFRLRTCLADASSGVRCMLGPMIPICMWSAADAPVALC